MKQILSWLYIGYFFASSGVLIFIAGLICLLTMPFDRKRRLLHYFSCAWGYHYVVINPGWKCHFEGLDNIDPDKAYVLVSNHQSVLDILVIYGLFKPFKWVSKIEIAKVPFVGWNMMLNQYVFLRRGDLKSIKEMMRTCRDWLVSGASLMIFPEGTRSEDGEIHTFRDGAFRLACENDKPLVPIVIDGTHGIMPKGSRVIDFTRHIRVNVLPPLDPKQFGSDTVKMRDYTEDLMKKTLAEMRARVLPPQLKEEQLS